MVKNYYRAFKDSIYDIDTDKITIEKKGIEVNYKYSAIKNYIDEKNFYLLSFEFCKLVVPKKFLSSKENEFLKGILEKYKIPPVTMMKDKQNNQNKYFKGLYLFYTIFYYI